MNWVALAYSPPDAGQEFVVMVGGSPTGNASPAFYAWKPDGSFASNGSTSTATCPAEPRAVAIAGSQTALTMAIVGNSSSGWSSCSMTVAAPPPQVDIGSYTPHSCPSGCGACGEAVDVAGTSDGTFYAVGSGGNSEVFKADSSVNWSCLMPVNTTPRQMQTYPGSSDVAVLGMNGGTTEVDSFPDSAGNPVFSESATQFTNFAFEGLDIALLGGTDGIGTAQWSDPGTWPQQSASGNQTGYVGAIAANGSTTAWLYQKPVGGQLYVQRTGACGGTQALPGTFAPVLPTDGSDSTRPSQAGHQIAITTTGSVFFTTNDGGWYWPCP